MPPPQFLQHPAQFRLEENGDGDEQGSQQAAQKPREGLQLQKIGQHRHGRQDEQPLEKLHGPRVHHQKEKAVDDEGDDEDVQKILPAKIRDGQEKASLLDQRTRRSR